MGWVYTEGVTELALRLHPFKSISYEIATSRTLHGGLAGWRAGGLAGGSP